PQLVAPERLANAVARDEEAEHERDDEHLPDDAERGEADDDVVGHGVTLDKPGWRNWSDAPDLKSGGLRAMRVRVPLPASAGTTRYGDLDGRAARVRRGAGAPRRRRRARARPRGGAAARGRAHPEGRDLVGGVPRRPAGADRRVRGGRARGGGGPCRGEGRAGRRRGTAGAGGGRRRAPRRRARRTARAGPRGGVGAP